MVAMKSHVPRIVELADIIVDDISKRQLQPGDPYQGTAETAEMLGVSTTLANRALQVLVKRRILHRRQRKGTFIQSLTGAVQDSALTKVHLLVQEDYLRTEGLLADGVVVGMHGELPSAQVQFNFLPGDSEAQYISELIATALRSGEQEAFVLVRASLHAQRLVAGSGMPTVVHGSLHPSVPFMPWIDRDHRQAGRLIVEHMLAKGMQKILMVMRDRLLTGDHLMLDSVQERMAEAGMPLSALTIRGLPADHEAVKASATSLLEPLAKAGVPVGVICRSEPLAKGVVSVAEELGLTAGKQYEVVVSDVYRKTASAQSGANGPGWTSMKSQLSPEQIGAHIGRMLVAQAAGEVPSPNFELIGVELEEPRR